MIEFSEGALPHGDVGSAIDPHAGLMLVLECDIPDDHMLSAPVDVHTTLPDGYLHRERIGVGIARRPEVQLSCCNIVEPLPRCVEFAQLVAQEVAPIVAAQVVIDVRKGECAVAVG